MDTTVERTPRKLRIGELSARTGLGPDVLRYYERIGLLPKATRSMGGYRLHAVDAVERVATVQAAIAIGFTLEELRGIVRARAAGVAPCQKVRALAAEKLARLESERDTLDLIIDSVRHTLSIWDQQLADAPAGRPARLLETLATQLPRPMPRRPGGPPRRSRSGGMKQRDVK